MIEPDYEITHYLESRDSRKGLCGFPRPTVDLNPVNGKITCEFCLELWRLGYHGPIDYRKNLRGERAIKPQGRRRTHGRLRKKTKTDRIKKTLRDARRSHRHRAMEA